MNNSFLKLNPCQETEKIIKFIQATLVKQKINHVVLGISGGVDSTLCAHLLQKAMPPRNITLAHLYYETPRFSSVSSLGFHDGECNFVLLQVKQAVQKIAALIGLNSTKTITEKIRSGNIIARTRMIILYDLSKRLGGLVCGTENRSEHLLGYFTRFGDEASDLEPLRHLYKTQVIALAKHLCVPAHIINEPPTAGLWRGQTDEKQLGFSYAEADQVLHLYFDKKYKLSQIIKFGHAHAELIITHAKNNAFKHHTPYVI